MSRQSDLLDLQQLAELRYRHQQQAFQKLVSEENILRQELARLDVQLRATRAPDEAAAMRAIGADMMWQAWVGRAKTRLNVKLAQVLARKAHHLAQVRRSHGKLQVIAELATLDAVETRRKAAKALLDQGIEHALRR